MRFCRILQRHEGVFGIGGLVVSLFRSCITFCKEGAREMISDLDGSLGSREFLNVANEILGVDQKERGLWGREWDMFCIVRVRI